ncbi:ELO family [Polychytrium aggregatum]|uniref:ELO family n=1 Tax=Polychytrium aggregatum TaxID=110093 RepID=UPI0022FDC87E|nr:ELO family [Polychytrium aggregatum]KAI9202335.1 ELO family [Polychytrium aggregatum]
MNLETFQFVAGQTPLTDLRVIGATWAIYATTILGLRQYMKNREPFKLVNATAIHNMILCIWSLIMAVGVSYSVYQVGQVEFRAMFCTLPSHSAARGSLWFWIYVYYISKFYELLDTVILVLKKKPIIFLHWFHHGIVVLMVWIWMYDIAVVTTWGMIFNTVVHVFMYYYYYAASLGKSVWFKKYITSGQIVQFVCSFFFTVVFAYYHLKIKSTGGPGCQGVSAAIFTTGLNFIFLVLFIQFYRSSYGKKKGADKPKKQ